MKSANPHRELLCLLLRLPLGCRYGTIKMAAERKIAEADLLRKKAMMVIAQAEYNLAKWNLERGSK